MYELPPKRPMFEGQRVSPKERPEKMSLMTAKTFLEKNLKNLYKVKILECYHQCHQQHKLKTAGGSAAALPQQTLRE